MTLKLENNTVRRITIGLICVGIILIAATALVFVNLRDRQQAVRESVREDAMWAVFQTHREASRLIEAILIAQTSATPKALAAVSMNFDLVYSRISLLEAGFFTSEFIEANDLRESAEKLQHDIRAMANTIDTLVGRPVAFEAALSSLLRDAYEVQSQSNRLVVSTNDMLGRARADNRTSTFNDYKRLAQMVATMAAVFLGTITLQFIQLRIISQTQRQLREMSARSLLSAKEAQAASKAKSMFLATMSHEIRTPLNGIIGSVDLLEQTELNSDQARRTLTIRRSGNILLDIINDILDFSNLDANGVTFQNAPVALPDLADLLTDIFRQRLDDANLGLEINVPPVIVSTDDVRLKQVLLNLIGNAIKFTPSGTIDVSAKVTQEGQIRFEVSDSGIGIPPKDHSKLFQDFSQIEGSASRRFGGSGLGLAISRRIVTGLGGNIGVESDLGQGSTFWFTLPVDVLGSALPSMPKAEPKTLSSQLKYAANVLLVEDNPINQEVAKALFESFGVNVKIAENGQVALSSLETTQYDLVVMDLQMPVMDGITATVKLRELGFSMPVVGLTANAFDEDRRRCLAAGMNDFVAKPVTREKIATVLANFATLAVNEDSEDLLDLAQMHPVLEEVGEALFFELLTQLEADGQALLRIIEDRHDQNTRTILNSKLHSLKGASATLGLKRVAVQAECLRSDKPAEPKSMMALVTLIKNSVNAAKLGVEKTLSD